MKETEVYSALTEIFADVFIRDDISLAADTTALDIEGWDSFKQIEIIMAVEERFGIKMPTREIDALKCVGDLANVVLRRTS